MTIFFSHIPKTAGTSLKFLVKEYSPNAVHIQKNQFSLLNPQLEFLSNLKKLYPQPPLVMGHFSYGVHRFLGLKPSYITILRNPLDRVVSMYKYLKTHPADDNDHHEYLNSGNSLFTFVNSCVTESTNNHMCRMIAGIPPDAGLLLNDQWLLDLALHNLKRDYFLVGIVDEIDRFTSDLSEILGWPKIATPRLNVAHGESYELDIKTKNIILKRNLLDMKLFEWVQRNRVK